MMDGPVRITAPFLDVLEVFLEAKGNELHGWAIISASKRGGPTVYKILERMAGMGWVTPRWEDQPADSNRPRRRYYRLTGDGASSARTLVEERRRTARTSQQQTVRPAFGGGYA